MGSNHCLQEEWAALWSALAEDGDTSLCLSWSRLWTRTMPRMSGALALYSFDHMTSASKVGLAEFPPRSTSSCPL